MVKGFGLRLSRMAAVVKVGCCGFLQGMARYFQEFRLVEVQQTFYRPPHLNTVPIMVID